ncbi:MAG: hypothetical protein Q9M91_00585 [Candidatus Dojkabacteria bacterium]|nr:hypothetical protein [Candidatus Dojkabacteria bacterium]
MEFSKVRLNALTNLLQVLSMLGQSEDESMRQRVANVSSNLASMLFLYPEFIHRIPGNKETKANLYMNLIKSLPLEMVPGDIDRLLDQLDRVFALSPQLAVTSAFHRYDMSKVRFILGEFIDINNGIVDINEGDKTFAVFEINMGEEKIKIKANISSYDEFIDSIKDIDGIKIENPQLFKIVFNKLIRPKTEDFLEL